MHHSRLVGGLAVLAVLLILFAAPVAGAASLTPVWSGSYATAAGDGFNAVATGPDGAVYAAGYAQAAKSGAGSVLLLTKYVDAGASMSEAWHVLAGGGAGRDERGEGRGRSRRQRDRSRYPGAVQLSRSRQRHRCS